MKQKITFGAIAVLAFCAGISVSLFTLPLWVAALINLSRQGNRTDWLGFFGGLLGNIITATVASVAIYFAWRGVKHQMRVGLVGREEERIEATLPGLKQMAGYLQNLRPYLLRAKADSINGTISGFVGVEDVHDSFDDKFEKTFSIADAASRQYLLVIFQAISRAADHVVHEEKRHLFLTQRLNFEKENNTETIEEARAAAMQSQTALNLKTLVLKTELYNLNEFERELLSKIELFEGRLRRFRQELEAFFDR